MLRNERDIALKESLKDLISEAESDNLPCVFELKKICETFPDNFSLIENIRLWKFYINYQSAGLDNHFLYDLFDLLQHYHYQNEILLGIMVKEFISLFSHSIFNDEKNIMALCQNKKRFRKNIDTLMKFNKLDMLDLKYFYIILRFEKYQTLSIAELSSLMIDLVRNKINFTEEDMDNIIETMKELREAVENEVNISNLAELVMNFIKAAIKPEEAHLFIISKSINVLSLAVSHDEGFRMALDSGSVTTQMPCIIQSLIEHEMLLPEILRYLYTSLDFVKTKRDFEWIIEDDDCMYFLLSRLGEIENIMKMIFWKMLN